MNSTGDICLVERGLYRQDGSACIASFPESPRETRVLHLDYLYAPYERLELWRERGEDLIEELAILYAGYGMRGSETIKRCKEPSRVETLYTRSPSPKNIRQIGVEITKFLTCTDDETCQSVVFFDSVSVMLQYVSLNTAVQFIEECLILLNRSQAGGRFYFTPIVHDEETVNTIEQLFSE